MIIWGKKEEELFKRELELRKTQAMLDFELNLARFHVECKKQLNDLEHEYHQAKEDVVKIVAKKEALELYLAKILSEKDETISTLRKTIEDLSRPQPIVK